MHANHAEALVKDLKSKSNDHFAFAPNGRNPLLLLGKRPYTAGIVKAQAEDKAGVVFTGGAIYLGQIDRSGKNIVFQVDEGASMGRLDAAKALLGLRTLRKALEKLGAKSPELKRVTFQIGAEAETDVPELDKQDSLANEIPAWATTVARLEARWSDVEAFRTKGTAIPNGKSEAETVAKLDEVARKLRSEMALAVDRQLWPNGDELKKVAGLDKRISDVLDRLDPRRAQKRATWVQAIPELAVPAGLDAADQHVRPMLSELNALLAGGTARSTADIADKADDLAQACLDRLETLQGRWRKDKAAIAAVLEVKRDALALSDRMRALPVMDVRGERVASLLARGFGKRSTAGVNGAQIVKNEQGDVRFVAKLVDPASSEPKDQSKVREYGQEVAAGALAETLSTALGFPRMVSLTTAAVVPVGDGLRLAAIQDAWKAKGDLAEQDYKAFKVAGKEVRVTVTDAQETLSAQDTTKAARELLEKKKVARPTDAQVATFLQEMNAVPSWKSGLDWEPLPVDADDLAEDFARIAVIDIITGQRDHRAGKSDNLMTVEEGGEARVKPIDFGLALQPISARDIMHVDFGAWSDDPAAAAHLPAGMADDVIGLDADDLVASVVQASRAAAKSTQVPAIELGPDQLLLLRVHTGMLQHALAAAKRRRVALSARDLASVFETEGAKHLGTLAKAAKAEKPPTGAWMAGQPAAVLQAYDTDLDTWLDAVEEIAADRALVVKAFADLREAVDDAEADPSSADATTLAAAVKAVRDQVAVVRALKAAQRETESRPLDVIGARTGSLEARIAALNLG